MKTFKTVIAMALALVLSLGVVSTAFAANGNSITWTVGDETVNCTYHSDLEVGVNTIKIEESDYYYFDLSDLENGYYSAKLTDDVFEYFCTPEKSGSKYEGWGEMEFIGGIEYIVFNRNENVDIAVAGAYGLTDSMTIEIEYLGEDIESVEIDNADELIVNYDIYNYGTDEWAVYLDTKVTFTGGKTIEAEDVDYYFSFGGEYKKGENTVNLTFVDYEWEQVLNVAGIDDYISGFDAEIPEGVAAYVHYDYSFDLVNTIDEITVKFKDGTSQKVNPNQDPCTVTLPNGRTINMYFIYEIELPTLKVELMVYIGGSAIGEFELETEKASFSDNSTHFKENMSWYIQIIADRIETISNLIANGNFAAAKLITRYLFNYIGTFIESVFNDIGLFVTFMFR